VDSLRHFSRVGILCKLSCEDSELNLFTCGGRLELKLSVGGFSVHSSGQCRLLPVGQNIRDRDRPAWMAGLAEDIL
jgi:hypothetical protein